MSELKIKGVIIVETFAEAFPMVGTRIIITAPSLEWALIAARTMTGFATSVIACGAEAGIERTLSPDETLDGRPGVAVLLFTMDSDKLQRQLRNRVGQCVLTSPGSACFAGLEGEKKLKLGASLRFFGDGWQMSKLVAGRRFWRIPVMDGEFLCEATTGLTKKAVGGGNLLVLGKSHARRARRLRTRGQGDRRGRGRDHARSRAASSAPAPRSARNTRGRSPPPTTPIARR